MFTMLALFLQEKYRLHSSWQQSVGKTETRSMERCEIGEELENMIREDELENLF